MHKSTKSRPSGKLSKPPKPYPNFPLFPHATGRWGKKVRQKIHFFGRWGRKSGDTIVPVEDVEASAATALNEFNRQWPYLSQGRTPPPISTDDGCTIRQLCNAFLTTKRNRMAGGELSLHSFSEYYRTCERLISFFGHDRRVDDLRPDDFEALRNALAKDCGVVTLKSKINRCRVVLKYASDNRLIDHPVIYGRAFDRPSEMMLRKARNEAGERMFEAAELRRILEAADPIMRAMVLLGINCGFGNTDIASLPQSTVDLNSRWVNFPRPKTAIQRRSPIWEETATALKEAMAKRPAHKDPADADLCFITARGTRYVRVQESKKTAGRHVTINALSRRFELLLDRLGINGRRGLGFYTLRHVFETVAGESKDQVCVDAIMGHVDASMAGKYRQRISDDRLRGVVDHVHDWLYPKPAKPKRKPTPK